VSDTYITDEYRDTDDADSTDFTSNFGADAAPAVQPAETVRTESPAARTTKRTGIDRPTVRRIIAKYEELAAANAEHLELLSTALGVPNTPAELTTAIVTGSRTGLTGLTDTLAMSVHADAYEGLIAAITLGRPRLKGVWGVLAEMGAVTGPMPTNDIKAGGAIAKAASVLDGTNKQEIAAVLALAKK
jgi:hypothetical protein